MSNLCSSGSVLVLSESLIVHSNHVNFYNGKYSVRTEKSIEVTVRKWSNEKLRTWLKRKCETFRSFPSVLTSHPTQRCSQCKGWEIVNAVPSGHLLRGNYQCLTSHYNMYYAFLLCRCSLRTERRDGRLKELPVSSVFFSGPHDLWYRGVCEVWNLVEKSPEEAASFTSHYLSGA